MTVVLGFVCFGVCSTLRCRVFLLLLRFCDCDAFPFEAFFSCICLMCFCSCITSAFAAFGHTLSLSNKTQFYRLYSCKWAATIHHLHLKWTLNQRQLAAESWLEVTAQAKSRGRGQQRSGRSWFPLSRDRLMHNRKSGPYIWTSEVVVKLFCSYQPNQYN